MEENKKNKLDTLSRLKNVLEGEVRNLEIRKNNLESEIHRLNIQIQGDRKVLEQEMKLKYEAKEIELINLKNKVQVEVDKAELIALKIDEREKSIVSRETEIGKFVKESEKLNLDRINFLHYKDSFDKELEIAKSIIAEANGVLQKIDL